MHSGNEDDFIWDPFCPCASGQSISHLYLSQDVIWCCIFRLHTLIYSERRPANAFLYTLFQKCSPRNKLPFHCQVKWCLKVLPPPLALTSELWERVSVVISKNCRTDRTVGRCWERDWRGKSLWVSTGEAHMHSELYHHFSNFIPFELQKKADPFFYSQQRSKRSLIKIFHTAFSKLLLQTE